MRRMTKRFGVMALVFMASAFSFATVTVSGNVVSIGTSSVSSRAFVRFWIRGCGGNQARVSGTGIILPAYLDFPVSAGAISGTVYDSLTEISCGGSVGATWYGVQAYYDGKPGPEVPYNVTGASFNLNNATPNTTSPVVASPTGDTTYQRLDGGNTPTGSYVPTTSNSIDSGSATFKWRTGYFGTGIRINDVDLTRSAADTLQLATGDQFLPQTSGQFFGGASNRWAGFFSTLNIGTSITLPSTSVADAALSSNVALYNNGSKTWGAGSSFTWSENAGDAGTFTLTQSQPATGVQGTFLISGHTGASSAGSGGLVQIFGGSGAGAAGSGGDIQLKNGSKAGAGSPGRIEILQPASGTPAVSDASAVAVYSNGSTLLASYNTGSYLAIPQVIASGTSTLTSSAVNTGVCATVVTTTATGAATTDSIQWAYASAPTTPDGKLILNAYPTANNVNFLLCNPGAGSLTPTGLVVNWRVIR